MRDFIIIALFGASSLYGFFHLFKTMVKSFARFIISLRKEEKAYDHSDG